MKYMWHWNFASNTSPLLPSPRKLQVFGTLLLTSHHCCRFAPERWSLLYPQKSFMEEKERLYSFATLWRCLVTNTFWQRWSTWSRGVIIQETVADLPQRVSDKGFRRGFLITICLNLQRPQRPRLPKYFWWRGMRNTAVMFKQGRHNLPKSWKQDCSEKYSLSRPSLPSEKTFLS